MLTVYLQLLDTEDERNFFEEVYLANRKRMYYCALRILGDSALAEDAIHEAFLRMLKTLPEGFQETDPRTAFPVVTIVKNISLNLKRRRSFEVLENPQTAEDGTDSLLEILAAGGSDDRKPADTSSTVETSVLTREASRAMELLSERQRDVLILTELYGYGVEETAELLGITVDAARKRRQRGFEILRAILGEKNE